MLEYKYKRNSCIQFLEKQGQADKTSAERGAKALNLQHFFAMAIQLNAENSFLIAIAVLACVLGAEIAGICILISKISHARRERLRLLDAEDSGAAYTEGDTHHYAAALLLGAIPMSSQLALLILAIATAVAALVFVVLLIIFRAQGYALVSARLARTEESEEVYEETSAAEEMPATVEEPILEEPIEQDFVPV